MLSELQLYKTVRLILDVESGMTDEDDMEHLEWLLDRFLLSSCPDLERMLNRDWESVDIDKCILEAYLAEGV